MDQVTLILDNCTQFRFSLGRRLYISLLVMSLFACDGSGGDSTSTSNDSGSGSAQSESITISGKVVKGVVKDALVEIYPITDGNRGNSPIATTRTNSTDGSYSVGVDNYSGPVIVQVSVPTDEVATMKCDVTDGCRDGVAFGDDMLLSGDFSLKAIVDDTPDTSNTVNITAVTDLASSLVEGRIGDLTLGEIVSEIKNANNKVSNMFDIGEDITEVEPIDITDVESFNNATLASRMNSLVSAAILAAGKDASGDVHTGLSMVRETYVSNNGQLPVNDGDSQASVSLVDILNQVSVTVLVVDVDENTISRTIDEKLEVAVNTRIGDLTEISGTNRLPVADPGNKVVVQEREFITLDGTNSGDSDGSIDGITWTQVSGPTVELNNADTLSLSFTAPEVTSDTELRFQLSVTDNLGLSNSKSVTVLVQQVNLSPSAEAGADQTVAENTALLLSGSESVDTDGSIAAYQWSQLSGTQATLSNSTEAALSFQSPEVLTDESLVFQLTVTDDQGETNSDTVTVTVTNVNKLPVAEAGDTQQVNEGESVILSAAGSVDRDGSIVTYAWRQTSRSSVVLNNSNSTETSFTAPDITSTSESLSFELTVTDNEGASSTDQVNINVQNVNLTPVANAGDDQTVDERSNVSLNGSSSSDPDGSIDSYSWSQTSGTSVILSDGSGANSSFVAPEVDGVTEILTFELTVTDNNGANSSDSVSLSVANVNLLPVAEAGGNQSVSEGETVTLSGTTSSDSDGTITSYAWEQTSGATATLSDSSVAQPTFTTPSVPNTNDTLVFQLTVTDNDGAQHTDTVQVVVANVNQQPVAEAGVDITAFTNVSITLDGSQSSDNDGTISNYEWTIGSCSDCGTFTSNSDVIATFFPTASGETTFTLVVTDNDGGVSEADSLTVTTVNPSFTINHDSYGITDQQTVSIVLGAVGASQVEISESATMAGAVTVNYSDSVNFTLSNGDGQKVLYARYSTAAGFQSEVVSDEVVFYGSEITEVSGTLSENTTWIADKPYVVTGDIIVPDSIVLTIDAGARIMYSGAYSVLVNGSVNANGTDGNVVTFTSTPNLDDTDSVQFRFQSTNLSLSTFDYTNLDSATTNFEIEGADCPVLDYSRFNTGTLQLNNVSASNQIKLNGIAGCDFGSAFTDIEKIYVRINSGALSGTDINRDYFNSPELWIDSSSLNAITVTGSSAYFSPRGVYIKDSSLTDSTMLTRQLTLENTTISDSSITNYSGFLRLNSVMATNTEIDNNSGYTSIANSTFTYDSSYIDSQGEHISMAQGVIANTVISGITGSGVSATYQRWNSADLNIIGTAINGFETGIAIGNASSDCTNNASSCITVDGSNLFNNEINMINTDTRNVVANGNYWGVTTEGEVPNTITDGNDDFTSGTVDYSNFLSSAVNIDPSVLPSMNSDHIKLTIRGDFNNWQQTSYFSTNSSVGSCSTCMTETGTGTNIFEKVESLTAGTRSFLITDADWNVYSIGVSNQGTAIEVNSPTTIINTRTAKNAQLTVPSDGNYLFRLDMSDHLNPVLTISVQ